MGNEKLKNFVRKQAAKILTDDAYSRMNNIRFARPEEAFELEKHVIEQVKKGRLDAPVDDETLKSAIFMYKSNRNELPKNKAYE